MSSSPPGNPPSAKRETKLFWGRFYQIFPVFLAGGSLAAYFYIMNAEGLPKIFRGLSAVLLLVLLSFSFRLYTRGRKRRAPSAAEVQSGDSRPPVIYLRSFKDDPKSAAMLWTGPQMKAAAMFGLINNQTEEQILVSELLPFGPTIAVGRPGEELPELGAARVYVDSSIWHGAVEAHLNAASLVVVRLGATEGLWWELRQSIARIRPERLLVIVPVTWNKVARQQMYDQASPHFPKLLPDFARGSAGQRSVGTIRGFIYFESDWTPHYLDASPRTWKCKDLPRFFNTHHGQALIHFALQPVYQQLAVPWVMPPRRWGFIISLATVVLSLFLGASAIIYANYKRPPAVVFPPGSDAVFK